MPGRNFMNSPMLPSAMVPNSSAATTLTMFLAKRCSLMASAAPSISLEVETMNESSFTTSPGAPGARAPPVKVMSRCTVCPGATTTVSWCVPKPVKKTFTVTVPAGTPASR
jgi:hypothetical protein